MNNYECFYKSKRISVKADSSYEALVEAAKIFKARRYWEVMVILADKPISPASIG